MGTHHISIRDGETIQVAMMTDGHITIAADPGQTMTVDETGGALISGDIDIDTANSNYPVVTTDARPSTSTVIQVSLAAG